MTYERPDSWDLNIGGFERYYRAWKIEGGFEGVFYTAQRRKDSGVTGPKLRARTLDELAVLIEAAKAEGG